MENQREKILQARYYKPGETKPEDIFKRVAKALADTEVQENEFYEIMESHKFLPNTPCLINAGDPNSSGQLFACFVLPIPDSIDGIFTTMHDAAIISKSGGGVGYNFGELRPRNSRVKSSNGLASGAISFMTAYDAATETIKQGGVRRGANMAVFPVSHPDVLDFIKCKDDTTKLNNFNISVALTDEFMNAVKNDEDWYFTFNGERTENPPMKARALMDMIVEQAWKNGEPGILFIDEINRKHPLNEMISTTNPCLSGESMILTADGYEKIQDREGQNIIINKNGTPVVSSIWCSGEKETVKILTNNNRELFDCTEDHKFMLVDGSICEAKDLKGKQLMPFLKQKYKSFYDVEFVKYGFIQGDGNLSELKNDKSKTITINIGKNDNDVAEYFGYQSKDRHYYAHGYNDILRNLGFSEEVLPNRLFPTTFDNWSECEKTSFIRGCYSSNGSVTSCGTITYKTKCKEFANQLNEYLKKCGYHSYITTNKTKNVNLSKSEYIFKESYDININQYIDRINFYNEIGFIQKYKNEKLKQTLIKYSPEIKKIKPSKEKQKVYDFTEPETHFGVVNGFVTHNCGW